MIYKAKLLHTVRKLPVTNIFDTIIKLDNI